MDLPLACELCAPFGGAWMETDAGLRRCDCERGKAIREAAKAKPALPPVLAEELCASVAEMMAGIPYYPTEAGARSLIANEIAAMCATAEQAKRLAIEMSRRYTDRWPGVTEMRAMFCSRFDPLDRITATSSRVERIVEQEKIAATMQIPAAPVRQIASGEAASAAPTIAATVAALCEAKSLTRAVEGRKPPHVPAIPVKRQIDRAKLEADMREAERMYRAKKKREEEAALLQELRV